MTERIRVMDKKVSTHVGGIANKTLELLNVQARPGYKAFAVFLEESVIDFRYIKFLRRQADRGAKVFWLMAVDEGGIKKIDSISEAICNEEDGFVRLMTGSVDILGKKGVSSFFIKPVSSRLGNDGKVVYRI